MAKNIVIDVESRKWCVASVNNKLSKTSIGIVYSFEFFDTRREALHFAQKQVEMTNCVCHVYKRHSFIAGVFRSIEQWFHQYA